MQMRIRTAGWTAAFSLLLVGPLSAQMPPASGPVVVALRPHIEVGCRPLTVGAVAEVRGADASLCQAIAALDLADRLGGHDAVEVTRKQIGFRIDLAGFPAGCYRLDGAEATLVTKAHYTPTEPEILAVATKAVRDRFGATDPEGYQIRLARPLVVQTAVPGLKEDVTLQANLHAPELPQSGPVQVDVSIYVGGQLRLAFAVHLEIRLIPRVAVATRALEKGEALTESAVRFERRAVDGMQGVILTPEALAGKRARRALLPGQIVLAGDTDAQEDAGGLLVHPREKVRLIVHLAKGFDIVTQGDAQENGRLGQIIHVLNTDSKRVVQGRVVDHALVEVTP